MRRFIAVVMFALIQIGCASITPKGPAVLSPFGDGTQWIVVEDMELLVKLNDSSSGTIVIPRGFVTDLASTPNIFWSKYPPFGKYMIAAVLHDYLYWIQVCERPDADKILYQTMRDAEVDSITQIGFYEILRVAGGKAWNDNRKEREGGLVRVIPERELNNNAWFGTGKTTWKDFRNELLKKKVREEQRNDPLLLAATCKSLGNEIQVKGFFTALLKK